jgi:hypothetical protein
MSANFVDQRLQFRERDLKLGEVVREGVFRANGFPDSVSRTSRLSMPREIQ